MWSTTIVLPAQARKQVGLATHLSMRAIRNAVVTMSILIGSPAAATDGVTEINQVAAGSGGITSLDTPGFPVTLAESGSYRLTGPLVTNETTDAIVIQAPGVFLDLNGFTISCRTAGGGPCSSTSGTAVGITASNSPGLRISNGVVTNFVLGGIKIMTTAGFQIEAIQLIVNRTDGLDIDDSSTGRISKSLMVGNSVYGIHLANSGAAIAISETTTSGNGLGGLSATIASFFTHATIGFSTFEDGVTGLFTPLTCYNPGGAVVCPP